MAENIQGRNGAEFLKSTRESLGLSTRDLAKKCQPPISSTQISHLENGRTAFPSLPMIPRLAQAYGVTISEILNAYGVPVEIDVADLEVSRAYKIGQEVLALPEADRDHLLGFLRYLGTKASEPNQL